MDEVCFIRLSDPFNLTGLPAISVPCGFGERGLPIGLQLAAAPFAEAMVLRVACAYEAATGWHHQRPPGSR
jgi:aspartyl-tRNA(Asn)/glutamyl-tRNA(Gln) amidotransferase subunit A